MMMMMMKSLIISIINMSLNNRETTKITISILHLKKTIDNKAISKKTKMMR